MTLFRLIKNLETWLKIKVYEEEVMVRINGQFYEITDVNGAIYGNKPIIILDVEKT